MDTRADFQRLLEDMDKVIRTKQQELVELDERLDLARQQLIEKESKELALEANTNGNTEGDNISDQVFSKQEIDELLNEQRMQYEQQITRMTDESIELESINQELAKQSETLRIERDSLKTTNEKLKASSHLLIENLKEIQSANFELNMRLASAESESRMQQKLLKKSHAQDQVLMDAFNDKLESLKKAIAMRDEEIKLLREDNHFTLESLGIKIEDIDKVDLIVGKQVDGEKLGQDDYVDGLKDGSKQQPLTKLTNGGLIDSSKKHRIIEIASVIREKDSQIQLLKNQLSQATKDLEQNASLIESLTNQQMNGTKLIELKDNCDSKQNGASTNEQQLMARCEMLENELEAKDKQLHLIEFRTHQYETILPNKIIDLIERLNRINTGRNRLVGFKTETENAKNNHVGQEQLVQLLTVLDINLTKLLQELNSSQQLLNHVEQLQRVNATKDAQIRRLVSILNELDFKQSDISQEQKQAEVSLQFDTGMSAPINGYEMIPVKGGKYQDGLGIGIAQRNIEANMELNRDDLFSSSKEKICNLPESSLLNEHRQQQVPAKESRTLDQPREGTLDSKNDSKSETNGDSSGRTATTTEIESTTPSDRSDQIRSSQVPRATAKFQARTKTDNELNANSIDKKHIVATPMIIGRAGPKATKQPVESSSSTYISLRDRLRLVEKENRLLELAMKEILMSIKWSDARCSTILIDCPSLERLCHLIEARFLSKSMGVGSSTRSEIMHQIEVVGPTPVEPSGDSRSNELFNLVVMKSELDLLRGQNEQLRAELKLQRKEFRDYLGTQNEGPNDSKIQRQPNVGMTSESIKVIEQYNDKSRVNRYRDSESQTIEHSTGEPGLHEQQVTMLANANNVEHRCQNCSKLTKLAHHLFECIVRIETKVNMSDEAFIGRFGALYKLSERLSKDLMVRENIIQRLMQRCESLSRQKVLVQTRLHSLESSMGIHAKVCPMYLHAQKSDSGNNFDGESKEKSVGYKNFKVILSSSNLSPNKSGQNVCQNLTTTRQGNQRMRNASSDHEIAISLLTSIIDSLKAMLNFKDEQINRLEQSLLVGD